MVAEMVSIEYVSEFRGQFPAVEPAAGVDVAELTKGDETPFFITLPFSRVGAVSRSKLEHDETLVDSLVAQINAGSVVGFRGHRKDAWDYPLPAVYWVGAVRDGDTAWAKGYIPPGATREDYRMRKALGQMAATSIYGPKPEKRITTERGTWRMDGFQLTSLDLGDYKDVSLQLDGAWGVTAELADQHEDGDNDMDKSQVIAELTTADVSALPPAVRDAIIAEFKAAQEDDKAVAELTRQRDAAVAELTELRTALAAYETSTFEDGLDKIIAELFADWHLPDDAAARSKVEKLQANIRRGVVAELDGSTDLAQVAEVLKRQWDDQWQDIAELVRDELMGPGAIVGGRDTRSGVKKPVSDEEIQAVVNRVRGGR